MSEGGNPLIRLIPEKVVEKVYDDALSKPSQQVGKLGEDVLKTARLLLAPIQLLGAFSDRFERWVDKIRQVVPEERQTQAPSEIAGPLIERMKYIADDSPLQQLYLSLLARSIDKERQNEAHPGFIRVIEQMSSDEAKIMMIIGQNPDMEFRLGPDGRLEGCRGTEAGTPWKVEVDVQSLASPERLDMYLSHLAGLNVLQYGRTLLGLDFRPVAEATEFGKLFIKACLPGDAEKH